MALQALGDIWSVRRIVTGRALGHYLVPVVSNRVIRVELLVTVAAHKPVFPSVGPDLHVD